MSWTNVDPQEVTKILQNCSSPQEAEDRLTDLRGLHTQWDSISRQWRRWRAEGLVSGAAIDLLHTQGEERGYERSVKVINLGSKGTTQLIIPDTQVRKVVPITHFKALANLAAEYGADEVIHLGDHWDMPSFSSYDSPVKKAREGRLKRDDIEAGNAALELFHTQLDNKGFAPRRLIYLAGNHDCFSGHGRIGRHLADHPDDAGMLTPSLFADSWLGWERYPFLTQVVVGGIVYSHTFPFNRKGDVTVGGIRMGASTADVQLSAIKRSCTAGHKQGLQISPGVDPVRGKVYWSVIAGSCYQHDEGYLGPAVYWRGCLVKTNVRDGEYNLHLVDMETLLKEYL